MQLIIIQCIFLWWNITGELHPGAANHNPLIEFHYQEESSSAALESEIEVNQENLIAVVKQENSLDETTNLNQIETASENWVIDDGQQQVNIISKFYIFEYVLCDSHYI